MKKVIIDNEVVELYNQGKGTCEISKRLGYSRQKILRTLKENGIFPERITRPYKNFYNINFFDNYNEYSSYWAGFIMADGNIHTKRKALQISLAEKDKDHLLKFSNMINFEGELIYEEKTNSNKIWISGKWYALSLEKNYGITSTKTFTCEFPLIPQSEILTFIRGYFDGDGCIHNNNGSISFNGNYKFLSYLKEYFYGLGIRVKNNNGYVPIVKSKSIFSITYCGENALSIMHLMYKNSNIYLDRKYKLYLNILEKRSTYVSTKTWQREVAKYSDSDKCKCCNLLKPTRKFMCNKCYWKYYKKKNNEI